MTDYQDALVLENLDLVNWGHPHAYFHSEPSAPDL